MTKTYDMTGRNRVRRLPDRGHYDTETIFPIIDQALICHVAFHTEEGPVVIPTLIARDGEQIFLHGATTSRLIQHMADGNPLSIAVTHIDGLVLARSIFHHSVNYRSAVLFGRGRLIEAEAKLEALRAFSEKLIPGRWQDARQPNAQELKATSVIAVDIESASAKIRSGPPGDDPEDLNLPVWAGILPLSPSAGSPIPAPELDPAHEVPPYVEEWIARRSNLDAG